MKKYVITIILVLLCLTLGVIYFKGNQEITSRVDRQVQAINNQVADFEEHYLKCKAVGDQYQEDILNACLFHKISDNFRSIYTPMVDEHYGTLDFCETVENNEVWDEYSAYLNRYAESKNIQVSEIWSKVDEFYAIYKDYNVEDLQFEISIMDFSENFYDFKYAKPKVVAVDYFGDIGNDRVCEIIQLDCSEGYGKLTISVIWQDGKIIYVNRGV